MARDPHTVKSHWRDIEPTDRRLLDQVRDALRLKCLSIRTEKAYANWISRTVCFHDIRHPAEMGAPEVQALLTHLAVAGNVASFTQDQALNALLFLTENNRDPSLLRSHISGRVSSAAGATGTEHAGGSGHWPRRQGSELRVGSVGGVPTRNTTAEQRRSVDIFFPLAGFLSLFVRMDSLRTTILAAQQSRSARPARPSIAPNATPGWPG